MQETFPRGLRVVHFAGLRQLTSQYYWFLAAAGLRMYAPLSPVTAQRTQVSPTSRQERACSGNSKSACIAASDYTFVTTLAV